jgi:hypothetical protein
MLYAKSSNSKYSDYFNCHSSQKNRVYKDSNIKLLTQNYLRQPTWAHKTDNKKEKHVKSQWKSRVGEEGLAFRLATLRNIQIPENHSYLE